MPLPELPSPTDLAGKLTTAAELLNRKADIASQIAELQAQDAALDAAIAAWTGDIGDIAAQLQALADAAAAASRPE